VRFPGLARVLMLLSLPLVVMTPSAWGGQIVLPPVPAFDRGTRVEALYRSPGPKTGKGQLTVTWTDVYGRLVEQRGIPTNPRGASEVRFTLDLRRAVAMQNTLSIRLSRRRCRPEWHGRSSGGQC
jgi:hypothetical protein